MAVVVYQQGYKPGTSALHEEISDLQDHGSCRARSHFGSELVFSSRSSGPIFQLLFHRVIAVRGNE